jgi:hypothetical protein
LILAHASVNSWIDPISKEGELMSEKETMEDDLKPLNPCLRLAAESIAAAIQKIAEEYQRERDLAQQPQK